MLAPVEEVNNYHGHWYSGEPTSHLAVEYESPMFILVNCKDEEEMSAALSFKCCGNHYWLNVVTIVPGRNIYRSVRIRIFFIRLLFSAAQAVMPIRMGLSGCHQNDLQVSD